MNLKNHLGDNMNNSQLEIISQQLNAIYNFQSNGPMIYSCGVIQLSLGATAGQNQLIAYMDITVKDQNEPCGFKLIDYEANGDILSLLITYKQYLLFGWTDDLMELRRSLIKEFYVPEEVLDLIEFNAYKHLIPRRKNRPTTGN